MKIGNFDLNEKCFIIAELSANHNGSIETAIKTIKAAKKAGADAIKLQTYTPDTMTLPVRKDDFIINNGSIWDGENYYDLYKTAYTPWEWHEELFRVAKEEGLICFSSPFDKSAVDFLEKFNPPAYKIASFEITDIDLIHYIASKQRPVIISTGIAQKEDIDLAIKTIRSTGNEQIILLKCTSSYPAPIEEANLAMIPQMAKDYNVITGLSDHTLGLVAPVVAVTLGAKVIEKHFIIDRSIGGPDSTFSLNLEEFSEMVNNVRAAESSLGRNDYFLTEKSKSGRVFSRSLYFSKNLKVGETITRENVRSVRPGFGLHPKHFDEIIGKSVSQDVEAGDRVDWKVISK